MNDSSFDRYATDYDEALQAGLSVSGEASDFFALSRVRWLSSRLAQRDQKVDSILDFGCGVGATTKHFLDVFFLQLFRCGTVPWFQRQAPLDDSPHLVRIPKTKF